MIRVQVSDMERFAVQPAGEPFFVSHAFKETSQIELSRSFAAEF
jgi:hypothetical protein